MALADIKKAILAQAHTEADKIKAAGAEKIAAEKAVCDEIVEKKKQAIIADATRRAEQKIQQAQFKIQSQSQTEILNQKQSVIDGVYGSALKKLSGLDDTAYVLLMEKLIRRLPDNSGELVSAKGKTNLLKKALAGSGRKYELAAKEAGSHGGFVFTSPTVIIDNTFETLIKNAKEQTILAVSNKLFGVAEPKG